MWAFSHHPFSFQELCAHSCHVQPCLTRPLRFADDTVQGKEAQNRLSGEGTRTAAGSSALRWTGRMNVSRYPSNQSWSSVPRARRKKKPVSMSSASHSQRFQAPRWGAKYTSRQAEPSCGLEAERLALQRWFCHTTGCHVSALRRGEQDKDWLDH